MESMGHFRIHRVFQTLDIDDKAVHVFLSPLHPTFRIFKERNTIACDGDGNADTVDRMLAMTFSSKTGATC